MNKVLIEKDTPCTVWFHTNGLDRVRITNPKPKILFLNNCVVDGSNFTLSSKGSYIFRGPDRDLLHTSTASRTLTKPTIVVGNHAGRYNYYHLLYQAIVPLLYLKLNLPNFNEYSILGPSGSSSLPEMLEVFDIANEYIKADNYLYNIENVVFTDLNNQQSCPLEAHKPILDHINRYCTPFTEAVSNKIFILREDAVHRKILNEMAAAELASKFGYEPVTLSKLSFKQQISLFWNSSSIIGQHGAGLANLIFCNENASIVEILNSDFINHCFFVIAKSKGMNYTGLINRANISSDSDWNKTTSLINLNLLKDYLQNQ